MQGFLILLFFLPPLFILFIVVFPCLWSFAFYFVKFLEIKNIYKILIIFSILTLILFSAYYAYYFTEIGWLFGPFFAAGLVAVPFYLWKWYKAEKEEKDNALIQRMPTLQDYFNKNKKRFITNKKMFFIGLFSVFISIWQIEVPQRIIVNFFGLKINIVDRDYVVLEHKVWNMKDNILVTNWVQYHNFLNYISFDKADIFICDEIDCKGNKKKIGEISMPSMPRSTLGCINLTGRCLGAINPPGLGIETFRNYLKEQSIKKNNK